jgi:hypothetical protein
MQFIFGLEACCCRTNDLERIQICVVWYSYCVSARESRMTGDCCRAEGIQPGLYIDAYARIHICTLI